MEKVEVLGILYYQVDLGFMSLVAFEPQELVIRMANMNLSLN